MTPLHQEGPACCEFDRAFAQAGAVDEPRSMSPGGGDDTRSRRPAEITSAVDERDAEASLKFRVLLTASLVTSLIKFGSNIVAVDCRDPL